MGSEDRKKAVSAKKFLDTVPESLEKLNELSQSLSAEYQSIVDEQKKLQEQEAEFSRIVENVYKIFIWKVFWKYEVLKGFCLWASNYDQSTYSKSLCSFPTPLDSAILHLVGKEPYYWMWVTGVGHRTVIEGNL